MSFGKSLKWNLEKIYKGENMKKIFGILLIISAICIPSQAFMGSSFDVPVGACVNHILVSSESEAIQLKKEINSFEDFQKFAGLYSQCPSGKAGGNLGCFGKGQMVKEFEKAAFKGNLGEVTGPIKTEFGYHLLWITRRY